MHAVSLEPSLLACTYSRAQKGHTVCILPHKKANHAHLENDFIHISNVPKSHELAECLAKFIGVAAITQLRTSVIKIVAFKGGHLIWLK